MKKTIVMLTAIVFIMALAGCNSEGTPTLEVAESNMTIEIGKSETIVCQVGNTKKTEKVLFSSDYDDVASVNETGLITAKTSGTAVITVSLEEYPDIIKTVIVTVPTQEMVLTGPSELRFGESYQFEAFDKCGRKELEWSSSAESVVSVTQNGLVQAVGEGNATITIKAINGETKEMTVNVTRPLPESVEITIPEGRITLLSEFDLTAVITPAGANQDVTWISYNTSLASVDENGHVIAHRAGSVRISATTVNGKIKGFITFTIEADPIDLFQKLNVANPIVKKVTTFGNTTKTEKVYGSVSLYWPGNLNLVEDIMPISKNTLGVESPYAGQFASKELLNAAELKYVRSGILKNETTNIIYHDTGNNNPGADARMHAQYIKGTPERARSWHYTVDDKSVYHSLPDNEVAWQGDTYEAYSTTIGVETCVNEGSDLYTTWHRTAKLMAKLLVENGLSVSAVKQHWDYSRKECPQALRKSGLYANAVQLIQAEYTVLSELKGYTITFTSHDPAYVNNLGRIIKLDSVPRNVSYTVTITNNSGYNESVVLNSVLPASLV